MAIKIEMLRCFSTVAQSGNLAEAALQLGRTQSAVSMTLKQLEEHLGQRLFEGERKNRLTELGEEIFALSRSQLRQFDSTVRAIETSANAPRGILRIASIPSVAGLIFPPAIRAMTEKHQGLRVELRDTDTEQVVEALTRGQADIGVVSGKHGASGIEQKLLFQDRFGLICSADHPLAKQERDPSLADVARADFVRNSLCTLVKSAEFHAAIEQTTITVHNTLSLIAMVQSGQWVTVLPASVLELCPPGLCFRPIRGLPDTRKVFLLLRERSPFLALAREMGDIVANLRFGGTTPAA